MSQAHVCRLCRTACNDAISLCDNYGQFTEVYTITIKFFHPSFLDLENGNHNNLDVMCFECWHHISGFNNFQQTILLVQAKLIQESERAKAAGNSSIIAADPVTVKAEEGGEEFMSEPKAEVPETSSKKKPIITDCALQFEVNVEKLLQNAVTAKVESVDDVISLCDSLEDEESNLKEEEFDEPVGVFLGGEFNNEGENTNASFSDLEMIELRYSSDEEDAVEIDDDDGPQQSDSRKGRETDEEWRARLALKKKSLDEMDQIIAKWKPLLECDLCKETCATFTVLQDHFREIHPGQKCYAICCERTFKYRCRLRDHVRVHLNPNVFGCKECNKSFSTRWTLDTHTFYVHRGVTEKLPPHRGISYKCKFCHQVFKVPSALREHLSEHTGEKIHKCLHCSSTFKHRSSFRNHLTHVHPDIFKKIKPSKKPEDYKSECPVCGKIFNYRTGVYHHLRVHHPAEFALRRRRRSKQTADSQQ